MNNPHNCVQNPTNTILIILYFGGNYVKKKLRGRNILW